VGDVDRVRAGYEKFAVHEAAGRSALYVELAAGVARDAELLAWLDGLPVGKRQPNLVFAAARTVAGTPSGFAELRAVLTDRRAEVEAVMLARRTQTNEPARCATLLPLLASLPQPLALLEVGASAGLCLLPDRYSYAYERGAPGATAAAGDDPGGIPAAGQDGGAVERLGTTGPLLRCRISGPVPVPAQLPEIAWRAGLDLDPVDVRDPEQTAWLEALVWPGEGDRLDTLRAALELARRDPPRVVEGDLTTGDLPALAAEAPKDATLVVFHTAVLAYVPRGGRAAFANAVHALNATWVANESPRLVGVDPATVPHGMFVIARSGVPVAWADSHGAAVQWL
jgi:hypothetical protein